MIKSRDSYIRVLAIISIITVLIATFAGQAYADKKLNVVTSTPDLKYIVQEIGGNRVAVTSIARGNQDPHYVEPKPSFMLLLRKADLYFVTGMSLEVGWSPSLERGAGNPSIMKFAKNYINCSNLVKPLEIPTTGMDRAKGDVHPEGNPHYMLDPNNAIVISKTIEKALINKDPKHAAYYKDRRKKFVTRATKAQIRWLKAMMPFKGMRVVTYHKNWSYFARRFGLKVIGTIEPKPGISPSPSHLAKLIPKMKAENAKIIITAPYFERKMPELVARSTGARVVVLPVMPGGSPGTDGYFKFFDYVVNTLVKNARTAGVR